MGACKRVLNARDMSQLIEVGPKVLHVCDVESEDGGGLIAVSCYLYLAPSCKTEEQS